MSTLRAAVLSAGAWSQTSHLPALAADPGVEIVAVSSPDPARRREVAAAFPVGTVVEDWAAALAEGPDIVVVSSPPSAHQEMVLAALSAGADVLVEKPFAMNATAARAMHRAAVGHGRALLAGFGWPASPVFAAARAAVGRGQLGRVEQLTSHLAVNIRGLLSTPADDASGANTYTDPATSAGGTIAVSMSHQFGLVCWLTGERVESVAARTFPPGAAIDLHAGMTVGLAGGGHGVISCAATHPYRPEPQWHLAVYGDAGQLWVDSVRGELRVVTAGGEILDEAIDGTYDPGAPTKALIAVGRGENPPPAMGSELAVQVCEITDAAYRSAAADGASTAVR